MPPPLTSDAETAKINHLQTSFLPTTPAYSIHPTYLRPTFFCPPLLLAVRAQSDMHHEPYQDPFHAIANFLYPLQ